MMTPLLSPAHPGSEPAEAHPGKPKGHPAAFHEAIAAAERAAASPRAEAHDARPGRPSRKKTELAPPGAVPPGVVPAALAALPRTVAP
ncbi:MAG: hypothetical protein K1X89_32100, partial [Myxococcaceae bacterium]|nr:hypothetical protein [Myxococcaceae bacterium]